MAQKKRLTRAQKVTLGKFSTEWAKMTNIPIIDMAELFARGLIESSDEGRKSQYRLTEAGKAAQNRKA